jgi:hypothetical protein
MENKEHISLELKNMRAIFNMSHKFMQPEENPEICPRCQTPIEFDFSCDCPMTPEGIRRRRDP